MAGKSSKKTQASQKSETFDAFEDDDDVFDDDIPNLDLDSPLSTTRSRDWRDVERHRELRELKKMVDDDFDDLFNDDLTGGNNTGGRKKKRRK